MQNMHDDEFTTLLFRFIQLTSEGHNNGWRHNKYFFYLYGKYIFFKNIFFADWQNYLRSQAGNTTTVNLVICTVDYLLRLQESMMDFYWWKYNR